MKKVLAMILGVIMTLSVITCVAEEIGTSKTTETPEKETTETAETVEPSESDHMLDVIFNQAIEDIKNMGLNSNVSIDLTTDEYFFRATYWAKDDNNSLRRSQLCYFTDELFKMIKGKIGEPIDSKYRSDGYLAVCSINPRWNYSFISTDLYIYDSKIRIEQDGIEAVEYELTDSKEIIDFLANETEDRLSKFEPDIKSFTEPDDWGKVSEYENVFLDKMTFEFDAPKSFEDIFTDDVQAGDVADTGERVFGELKHYAKKGGYHLYILSFKGSKGEISLWYEEQLWNASSIKFSNNLAMIFDIGNRVEGDNLNMYENEYISGEFVAILGEFKSGELKGVKIKRSSSGSIPDGLVCENISYEKIAESEAALSDSFDADRTKPVTDNTEKEELDWEVYIGGEAVELSGQGVLKIEGTVMISATEFCKLLGYDLVEKSGMVTITEGENCQNNEGSTEKAEFELEGSSVEWINKNGQTTHKESEATPLATKVSNEIYIVPEIFFEALDIRIKADSIENERIDIYTENYIKSDWANESIISAEESGFLKDVSGISYEEPISREKFCEIVYNMLDETMDIEWKNTSNPFEDTDNKKVIALRNEGIIYGKSEKKFAPDDFLTREQAATILYRLAKYMKLDMPQTVYDENVKYYSDKDKISDWAFNAVFVMYEMGIMVGTDDGTFLPKDTYTAKQAIATATRLCALKQ